MTDPALLAAARISKAWPFEEARKLLKRYPQGKATPMVFETGYGPSGPAPYRHLPAKWLRTTMIRRAFETDQR